MWEMVRALTLTPHFYCQSRKTNRSADRAIRQGGRSGRAIWTIVEFNSNSIDPGQTDLAYMIANY